MVGAGHPCLEQRGTSPLFLFFLDSGGPSTLLRAIYRQIMTSFGRRINTNQLSGGKPAADQEGNLADGLSTLNQASLKPLHAEYRSVMRIHPQLADIDHPRAGS